jgi:hypothetical protein
MRNWPAQTDPPCRAEDLFPRHPGLKPELLVSWPTTTTEFGELTNDVC